MCYDASIAMDVRKIQRDLYACITCWKWFYGSWNRKDVDIACFNSWQCQ
jgi:hypothetical protein